MKLFEMAGKPDPQGRAEELLDPRIERTEDPVELLVGDGFVGQLADEEHGVLHPDSERRAVELQVAAKEMLVELLMVLFGRGHHVDLVVQRALPQREPDRERVLLRALHADVPAALVAVAAIDGGDGRVVEPLLFGPRVDTGRQLVELRVGERFRHSRRARAWSGPRTTGAAALRSWTTCIRAHGQRPLRPFRPPARGRATAGRWAGRPRGGGGLR